MCVYVYIGIININMLKALVRIHVSLYMCFSGKEPLYMCFSGKEPHLITAHAHRQFETFWLLKSLIMLLTRRASAW